MSNESSSIILKSHHSTE